MRLIDLEPSWMVLRQGGDVVGLTFRCPHCPPGERGQTTYLGVMFTSVIDRDSANTEEVAWPDYMAKRPGKHFWKRTGDTFENLTISPSVDVSKEGHWHGHITNGEIVGGI